MGIINTVLGLISVFGTVLIASKIYQLYFSRRNNQRLIAQKIAKALETSKADALTICQNNSSLTSLMAKSIITEHSEKNIDTIMEKMNEFIIPEVKTIETHLGKISLLSNLSTLTGLIGTFSSFFFPVSSKLTQSPERANQLAEAVSAAMNYAAYGLGISIIFMVAYSILANRANVLTDDLSKAGLTLFSQLTKNKN